MRQEDKKLLMTDLCARLPFGVKVHIKGLDYEFDSKLVEIYNNSFEEFSKTALQYIKEC